MLPNPIRVWGPAAGWAAVLFLLSSLPLSGAPDWLSVNDKVVHFCLYGVLGVALAYGRFEGGGPPHWGLVLLGWVYGVSDEWHQSFVPGRFPSSADWAADALGVLVGYAVMMWAANGRRPTNRSQSVNTDQREPGSE